MECTDLVAAHLRPGLKRICGVGGKAHCHNKAQSDKTSESHNKSSFKIRPDLQGIKLYYRFQILRAKTKFGKIAKL
jgi:hypothetical protein